nr:glycosyltransferase N-terminal domain-containing protein [Halocynthiibacter namhaensis]
MDPKDARPVGPLVWLHACTETQAVAFIELAHRLAEDRGELWVLITTQSADVKSQIDAHLTSAPMTQTVTLIFADDDPRIATYWQPDICIWTGGTSHPALLSEIARTSEVMLLADAEISTLSPGTSLPTPGLRSAILRYFDKAFSLNEMSFAGLQTAFGDNARVENIGPLRQGACPPSYNEAEFADVSQRLAARPLWLAALCVPDEFEAVLTAHERALRSSHRLLLLICPAREEDGAMIKALAEARGLSVGLRSDGEDPEQDCQVYVADHPEEIGMWYRVASVCFVGQTLTPGHSPRLLPPAALGAALIFGQYGNNTRRIMDQLIDQSAGICVTDTQPLADAVIKLLAPDKAARLAHNAWETITEGAVILDRLTDIAASVLDGKGIPDAHP